MGLRFVNDISRLRVTLEGKQLVSGPLLRELVKGAMSHFTEDVDPRLELGYLPLEPVHPAILFVCSRIKHLSLSKRFVKGC